MIPKLHYYNPGHEMALLQCMSNYTPSKNVRKMITDLALLPAWYASPGDYILVEKDISPCFFHTLPQELCPQVTVVSKKELIQHSISLPKLEATPWGISPQIINLYAKLKKNSGLDIHLPVWNDELQHLTSRETAVKCFSEIKNVLPDLTFPKSPLFFNSIQEIEYYLATHRKTYILKTPYSSSGRGLLWLNDGTLHDKDRKWLNGSLAKQKIVSIEKALKKNNDFALEFYSDGMGAIEYQGISLFETNKRGAYTGNNLMNRQKSEEFLFEYIEKEKLIRIKEAVTQTLKKTYSHLYKGYIGVDMITYIPEKEKKVEIHPCIEINLRYTMGMAAICIFDRFIHEDAQGVFNITHESDSQIMHKHHRINKKSYPVEIKNGKLRKGYISLCPVGKDTNYLAYIIVK